MALLPAIPARSLHSFASFAYCVDVRLLRIAVVLCVLLRIVQLIPVILFSPVFLVHPSDVHGIVTSIPFVIMLQPSLHRIFLAQLENRVEFLVVDDAVAILEMHQDPSTVSTAVPVPEPEETVMVHRKPWKGGSDAGRSEAAISGRVAQKMSFFADKKSF